MESTLKLFVYGSLKVGECNDFVIRDWVVDCRRATVRGEMRLRPDNYPALFLSTFGRLGSSDYREDLGLFEAPLATDGSLIHGEVLELDSGVRALGRLDEFEGYFPGRASEYLRVAVTVETAFGPEVCWTYTGVGQPRSDWKQINAWPPEGLVLKPEPYEYRLDDSEN